MTTAEAREVLIRYNAWRRYDGPLEQTPLQPGPKEIGEAIDVAIEVLPKEEAAWAFLEEAAEKQINEALFKWSYDDEDGIEQYVHDAFIAGAQWVLRKTQNK